MRAVMALRIPIIQIPAITVTPTPAHRRQVAPATLPTPQMAPRTTPAAAIMVAASLLTRQTPTQMSVWEELRKTRRIQPTVQVLAPQIIHIITQIRMETSIPQTIPPMVESSLIPPRMVVPQVITVDQIPRANQIMVTRTRLQ